MLAKEMGHSLIGKANATSQSQVKTLTKPKLIRSKSKFERTQESDPVLDLNFLQLSRQRREARNARSQSIYWTRAITQRTRAGISRDTRIARPEARANHE